MKILKFCYQNIIFINTETKMIFLFPQKPKHIFDVNIVPKDYLMQIKKNGWRAEIISDKDFIIKSREGKKLSRCTQDDWKFLEHIFPKPFYLDGELVGTRQAGRKLNHIVIWDAPILGGKNLTNLNYWTRYQMLLKYTQNQPAFTDNADHEKFGTKLINLKNDYGVYLSLNLDSKIFKDIWADLLIEKKEAQNLPVNEGVVFKNPNARNLWDLYKTKENIDQLKMRTEDVN